MMSRILSRLRSPRIAVLALLGVVLLLPAQVLASVAILSPKSQAVVNGKVLVNATAGDVKFAYAVVFIDGVGVSATNTHPLRFELDTTQLTNGPHRIQLGLFDDSGMFAVSAPTAILVSNTVPQSIPAVKPAPAPAVKPAPVAASTPAATPAPAVAAAPKPAAAAPTAKPAPAIPTPVAKPTATVALSIPSAGTQHAGSKPVQLTDKFTIMLDGKPVEFTPGAYVDNGRMMVMLRPLVNASNGLITWDGQKATATIQSRTITITPNSTVATIDGREVTLDRPAVNKNGRIWVPATCWRALFGAEVTYQPEYRSVWLRTREAMTQADAAE